jgi:hypothetical protein
MSPAMGWMGTLLVDLELTLTLPNPWIGVELFI